MGLEQEMMQGLSRNRGRLVIGQSPLWEPCRLTPARFLFTTDGLLSENFLGFFATLKSSLFQSPNATLKRKSENSG